MERPLLAADIGGTHARFLRVAAGGGVPTLPVELDSREHRDLGGLLRAALAALRLEAAGCDACFAVAGPVREGKVRLTNLGWDMSEAALRREPGFRRVHLLNDLAAAAWCLGTQPPEPSRVLHEAAVPADGRCAVVSVSTGLGLAYWTPAGGTLRVDPTEGGHVGFAPSDAWEIAYLGTLQRRYDGRVSWERMLCGSGLAALEAHIRGGEERDPQAVVRAAAAGAASAAEALHRFSRMLGVFVGDVVLSAPVTGAIWLMGGVIAGLGAQLDRDRFLEGMEAKGRLSPELTRLPVRVTQDDLLGLRGACYAARAVFRD